MSQVSDTEYEEELETSSESESEAEVESETESLKSASGDDIDIEKSEPTVSVICKKRPGLNKNLDTSVTLNTQQNRKNRVPISKVNVARILNDVEQKTEIHKHFVNSLEAEDVKILVEMLLKCSIERGFTYYADD